MKLRLLGLGAALLAAGCGQGRAAVDSATAAPSSAPTFFAAASMTARPMAASPARFDGYGDTRFGMDEAQFAVAWQDSLHGAPSAGSTCFYTRPASAKIPADLAFMFEHGRFVRYEAGVANEVAPGGGKVGMSTMHIRQLYGNRVTEQPHKYVDGAKYLQVKAEDGDAVLVFETGAQGEVARWRVAVPPQIHYVEGCG